MYAKIEQWNSKKTKSVTMAFHHDTFPQGEPV